MPLIARIDATLDEVARVVAGSRYEPEVADIRARMHRPLRVAIAGRAKAGKSTLLNALVGERLAATDATECTRIVTWYRHDLGYSVTAQLKTGERRDLEFSRSNGLDIRLGGLGVAEVERIEVGWPSSRLADLTLIDTPGLDSASGDATDRTMAALIGDEPGVGEADAVIYLMRHLHRRDAQFLEAFEGSSIGAASPVTAVALLSRADELGAGRDDALASAAAIAARYAQDPDMAALAGAVLPIAGLLAETGASLRESEVAALRRVAALDGELIRALLLSVDRFRDHASSPLDVRDREELLARFGLFGLRFAIRAFAEQPGLSGSDLARRLVDASGIAALEAVIRRRFAGRSEVLRARSAVARLRGIAIEAARESRGHQPADPLPRGDLARALVGSVERLEATSPELAQLRLLHLVQARIADLADDERREAERVLDAGTIPERLGQAADCPPSDLQAVALATIERWRGMAGKPAVDRRSSEVAEGVARASEAIYLELAGSGAAVTG